MKTVAVIPMAIATLLLIGTPALGYRDDIDAETHQKRLVLQDVADTLDVVKMGTPDYAPPKQNQILHECSDQTKYPHGCCRDMKTPAGPGDKDESCARSLCYDVSADYCKDRSKNQCDNPRDKARCPNTCGLCKSLASPQDECEKQNSLFGCCWNGVPAVGPNNKGCPRCMNYKPKRLCERFKYDESCTSSRYGNTKFLTKYCPKFCGLC